MILYHTYLYYELYINSFIKENFLPKKLLIKILRQFLTNMSCPLTRGHTHHHSLLHFYGTIPPAVGIVTEKGGVLPNNQEWF